MSNETEEMTSKSEDCDEAQSKEDSEEAVMTTEIDCEPSAPNFEAEEEESAKPVPKIHSKLAFDKTIYPNLQELAPSAGMQISEKIMSPLTVKPFTQLQMEQLYANCEIQLIEMFETEFVEKELRDNSIQEHPLYALLKKYGKSRSKYLVNLRNIAHLTKNLDSSYKKIWRIEKRNVASQGTCDCGKAVRASHSFEHAVFDEEVNSDMSRNLKELLTSSCFNHTKYSQDYELCQRQIEQMIGELMNSRSFEQVAQGAPVVLNEEIVYTDLKSKINELRIYISILFKFLRDTLHDKFLINSVQDWIRKLVSLQLRIATWQDHVFILFHVLRCPVGVGNWAANLIQVPILQRSSTEMLSPFSFPEFQHCVAILAALLLPVKDRGMFLEGMTKDLAPVDNAEDEIWILVDSDGEEGSSPSGECIGLKENDLVAIFDQIPFEKLFMMMIHAEKKKDEYTMDFSKISGHHVIKSIAFASKLIEIIKRGLTTYDSERYKQFAKRLGRLVKHVLFYISDIIQLYRSRECYKDLEELQRIQVEFDGLIV